MFLHQRLLNFRGNVDDSLMNLDECLRIRLEIIYDFNEKAIDYAEKTTHELIKLLPKIDKLLDEVDEENKKSLDENAQKIEHSVRDYNEALEKYNAHISKPLEKIIGSMVGLKNEKIITINVPSIDGAVLEGAKRISPVDETH